jgi:hypothetical protein
MMRLWKKSREIHVPDVQAKRSAYTMMMRQDYNFARVVTNVGLKDFS